MTRRTLLALAVPHLILRKTLLLRPPSAVLPAVFIKSHSCSIQITSISVDLCFIFQLNPVSIIKIVCKLFCIVGK